MYRAGDRVCGYEILEPLGQGGLSQSFKARAADGTPVTLKFPSTALVGDPSTYERLRREFKIGQLLAHPAVPRAIEMKETETGPCMVLEYVEGKSLRLVLHERGSLPLDEVLSIATEICQALGYVHGRGVYHRDLKPENVVINASGRVHIVDFGIAFLRGARRITFRGFTGDASGTADYMAPERIQGKSGDARTDIYSLGIMLYEMLTGEMPFSGDDPLSVMNQHLTSSPVPPRRFQPSLPPVLEAVILKSIRRNPAERYQTAAAFLHDLTHYKDMELSQFDLGPEKKARGVLSQRQIWVLSATVGLSWLFVVALVVAVVLLVRHAR